MARKKKSASKKKRASGGAAVEVGAAAAEEPVGAGEGKKMLEEEVDEGNGTDESSLVSSAVVENEEDEVVVENGGESASCCADGSCANETPTAEPPVETAAETSTEEDEVGEMAMEDNSCASKGCCGGGEQDPPPVVLNERAVEELEAPPCTTGCCGEKAAPPPPLPSAATASGGGACCSNVQDGDGVVDTCCSSPPPPPLATAKESSCCASSSTGCSSKSKAPLSSSSSSSSATPKTMADRVKALKLDRENLLRHPTPSLPSAPSRGGLRVDTLRLRIGGMTCSGCCTRIEGFLSEQPGVFGVNVSLLTSRGAVDYDPNALSPEYIETLVTTLGFTAESMPSDTLAAVVLFVGRDPPERVRQKLLGIEGVVSVRDYSKQQQSQSSSKPVDLATAGQNSVLVEYDPDVLGARTLVRKLSASMGGFHVQASAPRPHTVESEEQDAAKFAALLLWSCLLSLPVLFVAYIAPLLGADVQAAVAREIVVGLSWQDLVGFVCATPILLVIAYPIHESAFLALRFSSRVTMDVLISLSSCLAYSFSLVTIALRVLQLLAVPSPSPAPAPVLSPESATLPSPLPSPLPPPSPTINSVDETFFEVTALLITLILLGRYMEKIVKAKASHSVDALLKVQAKTAILLEPTENRESYIDVLLVERGDQLKVLPGARVPTDGVVVEGASSVDESMVTGESRKVLKEVGSKVIGGTINAQGVLVVRVTHTINESMLARIVHLVDEAQASKCVSQSVADAVSSYFTTFIITVAIIMFVVWYELATRSLIDTRGWMPLPFALRFAITILVISCPCAISLAVPTVIMVATTIGSQFGVLFKGGHALEALDAIDVVMFDKTGTLTTGKLQVVDFLVASSFTSTSSSSSSSSGRSHHNQHKSPLTPRKLWTYLAAAERNSEHAIARAVLHYAKKVHTPHADVTSFQSIPGCGVRCRVDAHTVCVGSLKWMLDVLRVDVPLDLAARNELYQRDGCVVVCLAIDNALCALVALQDTPRAEAHFVIDQLRQRKIQTWIVTGDQRETALSVAAQLGIPEVCVIADALPHQKVDKVRLLQGIGKRVAFIGDGVNDGPALAMAHVGVAVGAGTDVAIESADLVLVKDDLRDLLNALDLSRATNRLIRWNFSWGFLYNLIMMPLACGALYPFFGIAIPPALAGLSELLSSVPVILFSLLLNFWKPPFPQSVGGAGDDDASEGSFVAIDVRKDPMTEATPLLARH